MEFGAAIFFTDYSIGPAELGRALEERGFESLFVAEHTHIPVERRTPYPGGGNLPRIYFRTLDPFVALTAAAAVTTRLVVGTGIVLIPQHDPITTAKEVASLDLVSGGRFAFGVGVGWNREEIANHGTNPTTRGRLTDESLEAMQQIWTQDVAEYHGEFVNFDPIHSWPKPVQQPHPPIYVGGGEAAFRRIAKIGAGWISTAISAEDLAPSLEKLREAAGADVRITATSPSPNPDKIAAYDDLGIERVTLQLPTAPEKETLEYLDQLATTIAAAT
jgi:probable F420-dependent oxidoreductase